ncbi:MAG: single-stranded DNA-binding protein [Nocardioides sp.]|uniref:single-stranded DNA-binding protein n=1 Tax=Nocardioides sp. TaxID=35761 RepID=UPI0039E2BAA8
MSIPTQMSLTGFIASDPQLTSTKDGTARFYARIGVEHARKEPDGTFTPIEPSFHDMVLFGATAEKAHAWFRKGDSFVSSGYAHEYDVERDGKTVTREEFVARRIGHDAARTRYEVDRTPGRRAERSPIPSSAERRAPDTGHAVGL